MRQSSSGGEFRKLLATVALAFGALHPSAPLHAAPTKSIAVGAEPVSSGGPLALRRLTQDQYKNSIADIFGADIRIPGRFENEMRRDGLLAVGSRSVSISPAGMEQYDLMARNIAAQVVDATHRSTLLSCAPADAKKADEDCARKIITEAGLLLFRRPLTSAELQVRLDIVANATRTLHDFYGGIEYALTSLLVAPQFLFRDEVLEPDPTHPSSRRLDGYSKAARLSFLLWNTAPDRELLAAAASGDLHDPDGLMTQVDRLVKSPRVESGLRAFFGDLLGFDAFPELSKDSIIYPNFSLRLAQDEQEQTLRTIVDHLLVRRGDYRDLFVTRRTFVNPTLSFLYRVPVSGDGWRPYDVPRNQPYAGILTQPSFVALHAHPGRSSATLRGKAVRELLMCQEVPAPPGNVDFKIVQDTTNPDFKTARARLTAHRTEPMCAGCHKFIDPIGLALEKFDGMGQFRSQENGVDIDASGDIDGIPFTDAASLGTALRNSPAVPSCLVERVFAYGTGHAPLKGEREWLAHMVKRFAADGYRVPDTLRNIALSSAFYAVAESNSPPSPLQKAGL